MPVHQDWAPRTDGASSRSRFHAFFQAANRESSQRLFPKHHGPSWGLWRRRNWDPIAAASVTILWSARRSRCGGIWIHVANSVHGSVAMRITAAPTASPRQRSPAHGEGRRAPRRPNAGARARRDHRRAGGPGSRISRSQDRPGRGSHARSSIRWPPPRRDSASPRTHRDRGCRPDDPGHRRWRPAVRRTVVMYLPSDRRAKDLDMCAIDAGATSAEIS